MSDFSQDDLKKAVAEEIARLTSSGTLQIPTVPDGEVASILPHRQKAGNYEFDPTTQRILNPHVTRHLWRADNVKQCACGQMKWAHVQEYKGERAITDALRPVVHSNTGQLIQQPHQDAYAEYDQNGRPIKSSCKIPNDLQMTPEKAAHAKVCSGERMAALAEAGELEEVDEAGAKKVIRMARHGA